MSEVSGLDNWTRAAWSADEALKVPIGLMSFSNDGRGQPSTEQRHLYMAAVAFTYAVWENYVEELSIELTGVLAAHLPDERVPPGIQTLLVRDATAWELAVHPGWRGLWVERVRASAKGGDDGNWGLNTANAKKVRVLFDEAGIGGALPQFIGPPLAGNGRPLETPSGTGLTGTGQLNVESALQKLVSLRGEAVHTATTTDKLLKREVLWWSTFVESLYHETDRQARAQCKQILGE